VLLLEQSKQQDADSMTPPRVQGPRHRFSTFSLVCLVIANMIGAGVYTSTGFALADLKRPWMVLAAWAVAGIISLLGAVCYGRLAQWLTVSGGEYLFLSRAVSPLVGFMAGWVSLTAGFSGAIAYSAITFNVYLTGNEQTPGFPAWLVPTLLIVLFGILHLLGMEVGTRFQNLLVLVKLVALVGFLAFAVFVLRDAGFENLAGEITTTAPQQPPFSSLAFATSVMWLSFSYAGYNAAIYVAGASMGASTVARSMIIATVIVTVFYLLLNGVILAAVPPDQLAGQPEVLRIAAQALGGGLVGKTVHFVILLSLATSVSAMLQTGPHVYAQMARDGFLPRFLASEPTAPPRAATILQIVLAILLTIFVALQQLLDYLAFVLLISSAATASILLLPQHRRGARWVIPLGFVVASVITSILALRFRLQTDPRGLMLALAVLLLGFLAYALGALFRPPVRK